MLGCHTACCALFKTDNTADDGAGPRKVVSVSLTQEERFAQAKREKNRLKQRAYREKVRVQKQTMKEHSKLKWEKLGGAPRICMRIHQYEMPVLRRIVQLGTCPIARGSLVPTARIASHMFGLGKFCFFFH